MKKYIMALDQGTTSSRCILFDIDGKAAATAQREYPQIYPHPGWVEHDPMAIWSSQFAVATEALASIGAAPDEVAAIGIANQRETTIVWDRHTGKPVYNAIVWQCRRTADMIDQLDVDMHMHIQKVTGLEPDAYFSATKIKWILDNAEGAREAAEKGDLLFGTVDTWILWNLTGGKVHATDYTNASRTMLFDIRKLKWDQEILDYFGIPASMLPEVHPSGYNYGLTDVAGMDWSIPVCGMAGDQQASLYGLHCFNRGDVKNTYGTGCFLLMNTGKEALVSSNGLLTTIAAGTTEEVDYVLEGSIFIGGAVIQWLRDELKLVETSPDSEAAAMTVEDTAGAYLVPAFTGLGAPYWNQDARGVLVGLTRGFNKNHFIRAALESIAYQSMDVIKAMEADLNAPMSSFTVDGGAAANNFLMQFQADLVNASVERPVNLENTALGAAYLAGLTAGFWKDKEDIMAHYETGRTFKPSMSAEEREKLIRGWKKAINTACAWAVDDGAELI